MGAEYVMNLHVDNNLSWTLSMLWTCMWMTCMLHVDDLTWDRDVLLMKTCFHMGFWDVEWTRSKLVHYTHSIKCSSSSYGWEETILSLFNIIPDIIGFWGVNWTRSKLLCMHYLHSIRNHFESVQYIYFRSPSKQCSFITIKEK